MGPKKTRSQTQLQFSPETLEALGTELFTQITQLNPIQREQILRAAALSIGQPGAEGAPTVLPEGLLAPVEAGVTSAAPALNLDIEQIGRILDTLQGGVLSAEGAARKQAGQITSGVTSFIDPRFASILSPTPTTTSKQAADPFQIGLQAAGVGAAIATPLIL